MISTASTPRIVLARYGAIAEVARFRWNLNETPRRGMAVVVKCHRGEMLGTVLEPVRLPQESDGDAEFEVLRVATAADEVAERDARKACADEFPRWQQRIDEWNLELQLIELERTLGGEKTILYVLCDRGPDSTKLALQAAAAGLGIVEVQPVNSDGLVQLPASGGCGSGGCGSGGGGCGH